MYAIRSYYESFKVNADIKVLIDKIQLILPFADENSQKVLDGLVITSYSIHYTKLYETTLISYNIVYYLFGLAMSLIVSILAGIAPAVKAADLDPAVSLRFE